MIIKRYLFRELMQTTLAVTAVLLVVIMSGRFVKYLAEAAAGKMDPGVLFEIMFYRLPGFLELIIPLAFFIAILMAYGRLYAEQEMTVLFACGLSRYQILQYTYLPALLLAVIVGACSLWLSPLGLQKAEQIIQQQRQRHDFESLQVARFQRLQEDRLVSYAENLAEDQNTLNQEFNANQGITSDQEALVLRSQRARTMSNQLYQQRYLVLYEGIRYQGTPGSLHYRVTRFREFAQHIQQMDTSQLSAKKINARLTTTFLWQAQDLESQAALQWRFAIPLLLLVVTLLGVTMSHTTPRRGRYVMLFPSILLYLVYLVVLNAARGAIEDGSLSPHLGLWLVHTLFFILAITLFILRKKG